MDDIAHQMGMVKAEILNVNQRLTDHIDSEERFQKDILEAVRAIEKTLSEATGARKVLVWLLGVTFAAVALAKGWIWGK